MPENYHNSKSILWCAQWIAVLRQLPEAHPNGITVSGQMHKTDPRAHPNPAYGNDHWDGIGIES